MIDFTFEISEGGGIASGESFGLAVMALRSVKLICMGCGDGFLYDKPSSNRKAEFCRGCIRRKKVEVTKAWKARHLLRRGTKESSAKIGAFGLKALRSHAEVGRILGLSGSYVEEIEKSAFRKLRDHPDLQKFWREYAQEAAEAEAEDGGAMTPRRGVE